MSDSESKEQKLNGYLKVSLIHVIGNNLVVKKCTLNSISAYWYLRASPIIFFMLKATANFNIDNDCNLDEDFDINKFVIDLILYHSKLVGRWLSPRPRHRQ